MTKTKKQNQPRTKRGSAPAVDVVVGDKKRHAGLVSIEHHGKDERGRLMGTNGIRWTVPA